MKERPTFSPKLLVRVNLLKVRLEREFNCRPDDLLVIIGPQRKSRILTEINVFGTEDYDKTKKNASHSLGITFSGHIKVAVLCTEKLPWKYAYQTEALQYLQEREENNISDSNNSLQDFLISCGYTKVSDSQRDFRLLPLFRKLK